MGVKLAAASGGSVELVPTNTASNFTVTVPAVTGTMLTNKSAGTVLQVVNAVYSTQTSSSSSTFVDTGLTASITPTSNTSKILVLVNQNGGQNSPTTTSIYIRLVRDGTGISTFGTNAGYTAAAGSFYHDTLSTSYLDSPATTSTVVYKTQFQSRAGVASVSVQESGTSSTITLMEIAA